MPGRYPRSPRDWLRSQKLELPYPSADHTGRTVIITGANVGLGFEAARHFARLNATRIILAVRTPAKGTAAAQTIETSTGRNGACAVWELNKADYGSIRAFAARVEAELDRVDVVVESAGLVSNDFVEANGEESQMGVNVLGTFLLAVLLLPKLIATAALPPPARATAALATTGNAALYTDTRPHLVIISSEAHEASTFTAWSSPDYIRTCTDAARTKRESVISLYSTSKLFQIILTRELARRVPRRSGEPEVVVNCVNPGLCYSALGRDFGRLRRLSLNAFRALIARSTEMGSRTYLAAASLGPESHGGYVSDCVVKRSWEEIPDEDRAKFWDQVMRKVGVSDSESL